MIRVATTNLILDTVISSDDLLTELGRMKTGNLAISTTALHVEVRRGLLAWITTHPSKWFFLLFFFYHIAIDNDKRIYTPRVHLLLLNFNY